MQTTITVARRCCRLAVVRFGKHLARAGLPVKQLRRRDKDRDENKVCFEWSWGEQESLDGWEREDEPEDPQGGRNLDDVGLCRLVEHYARNLHLLGSSPALARSWLRQHGADRRDRVHVGQ